MAGWLSCRAYKLPSSSSASPGWLLSQLLSNSVLFSLAALGQTGQDMLCIDIIYKEYSIPSGGSQQTRHLLFSHQRQAHLRRHPHPYQQGRPTQHHVGLEQTLPLLSPQSPEALLGERGGLVIKGVHDQGPF